MGAAIFKIRNDGWPSNARIRSPGGDRSVFYGFYSSLWMT